eukprot:2704867-Alexandrium_andersonii.AAC.1
MDAAALLRNAGCSCVDLQQPMYISHEKLVAINAAMDIILTMENEFKISVHANLTGLWQLTLRVEYGPTTRDRVEA